jgi:hypothetical protein
MEFTRSFLCFKRDAPEVVDVFPATTQEWTVPPREGDT